MLSRSASLRVVSSTHRLLGSPGQSSRRSALKRSFVLSVPPAGPAPTASGLRPRSRPPRRSPSSTSAQLPTSICHVRSAADGDRRRDHLRHLLARVRTGSAPDSLPRRVQRRPRPAWRPRSEIAPSTRTNIPFLSTTVAIASRLGAAAPGAAFAIGCAFQSRKVTRTVSPCLAAVSRAVIASACSGFPGFDSCPPICDVRV